MALARNPISTHYRFMLLLLSSPSPLRRIFFTLPLLLVFCAVFTVPALSQETEPDAGAQNPVEQLPTAPDTKSSVANNAAAPRETPPRAAPAGTGSTPRTPGALVPDDGWEILDAPRQIPPPSANSATPTTSPAISNESLRAIVTRLNLALPLAQGRIVIDKSERRLDLYNGSTLVKSYGVALGKNPFGHKMREGDGRTPEGDFYICTRNAKNSAFHIFLGLSYPALPDAKRAANSKQITWREYQMIHQRLASRGRPPWETNLGGWVGIHGGTDANFAQKKIQQRGTRDWTAGCIALTNREIEELHAATRLGTPVHVQP
jgi:lipoprotein-anchoring transpeptidase ErfK/SrfK